MKSTLLLPRKFKWIGLILFVPSLALGIGAVYYDFYFSFLNMLLPPGKTNHADYNYGDELALTGVILGLLMMAFSREKNEDEYISKIRLESLQWAVIINYVLLIIAAWIAYGWDFFDVMVYNMLTILLIFNILFHGIILKNKLRNKE
ncbi:MAG: hypothetical protein HYX40_03120 [Sphingobacteriales bacterium]|nr:hypothetical protein [Sphingobacteriales bacterium]